MTRRRANRLLVIAAGFVLAGCQSAAPSPSPTGAAPPDLYIAVRSDEPSASLMAILEGTLVVVRSCVWVDSGQGARYLPVWPRHTVLIEENKPPGILVIADEVEPLLVGMRVRLTGGESPVVPDSLREPLPAACDRGPFWLVGGVARVR